VNAVQPSLFEPPETGRSRHRDPSTSIVAGSHQRGGAEQAILGVLREVADATRDEIAARLPDWHAPTLSTALSRLLKSGGVRRTGAARPSRRGQLQEVVQICDVGHAYGRSWDGEPSITPGRGRPPFPPTPNEWKDSA
jgi:hypothetical protein